MGKLAYVWTGIRHVNGEPAKAKIRIDGTEWFDDEASCVLVGNVSKITGGIQAFDDAKPDDGWLDVGVATAQGAAQWARTLGKMAVGRSDDSPFVRMTRAREIDVKLQGADGVRIGRRRPQSGAPHQGERRPRRRQGLRAERPGRGSPVRKLTGNLYRCINRKSLFGVFSPMNPLVYLPGVTAHWPIRQRFEYQGVRYDVPPDFRSDRRNCPDRRRHRRRRLSGRPYPIGLARSAPGKEFPAQPSSARVDRDIPVRRRRRSGAGPVGRRRLRRGNLGPPRSRRSAGRRTVAPIRTPAIRRSTATSRRPAAASSTSTRSPGRGTASRTSRGLGLAPQPVGRLGPVVQGQVEGRPVHRDHQAAPHVDVGGHPVLGGHVDVRPGVAVRADLHQRHVERAVLRADRRRSRRSSRCRRSRTPCGSGRR